LICVLNKERYKSHSTPTDLQVDLRTEPRNRKRKIKERKGMIKYWRNNERKKQRKGEE